jgi:pyruvate,water dikinase
MAKPLADKNGLSCAIHFDQAIPTQSLGGKAGALARLRGTDFRVPPWIVLTPDVFDRSVTKEQREALATATAYADIAALFDNLVMGPDVKSELINELQALAGEGQRFAVRSSAADEDSGQHSFAGQLDSYLFVSLENVPQRVADVWRSGYSERVFAYRKERGLSSSPGAPAVLIQVMVDADVSGVAFSVDPVSGDRDIAVVGSVFGLGTALVSGEVDADTHRVDGHGVVIWRELGMKTVEHRFSHTAKTGVAAIAVDAARTEQWALSDAEVASVASLVRKAETFFGRPQDIEWAMASGELYLLQSRPITSLGSNADGALNIWDNSNISESYNGVTTPLTFSFARNAYEGVYTQLCRIFGIAEARIDDNRAALENMIGLIRGRIYYNVLNWYRLLSQSPGYRTDAAFFEQMIGLQETIPPEALGTAMKRSLPARLAERFRLLRTSISILVSLFTLDTRIRGFYERVEAALTTRPDLATLRADELVGEYRLLVSRLITRWDAPLVNDFFAMTFYGVLRKLCVKWCGDEAGTLQNNLLCATGGMVSTEPAERLQTMARIASEDVDLAHALREKEIREITPLIEANKEFRQSYQSYLDKFGERCTDELKLESHTLHDDPTMLLRAIGTLAAQNTALGMDTDSTERAPRVEAEERVCHSLASRPLKRWAFAWVLRNCRVTIRNRENLRMERTRVFGRVRRIFVELGERLSNIDAITNPRDIFYLATHEVIGFVEGTAVTTDLHELVALRKTEFAKYERQDPPPNRFETRGVVYHNRFDAVLESDDVGDMRTGIGCCPGKVSGRVRVVNDPRTATLRQGDILVAKHTDPSWIMLFPFASGLLVERGNLLSHAAIVAREMGIPAIVAVSGVTRWLSDGDTVELDGASGMVRRTSRGEVKS